MIRTFAAVLLIAALAGCSSKSAPSLSPPAMSANAPAPAYKVLDSSIGPVLATNRGMTLYTFAQDTIAGISMCNDACAANWLPLVALDDARPSGKWTVVQRPDGLKQWAYAGKPLYGWHEDRKPGDVLGEGRANGAWTVARP